MLRIVQVVKISCYRLRAALAVGADGVMAEVHPDPSVALSDAGQQMDLDEFKHFMMN